jgi:predicted aspartyl protease/Flp pilus assembly protein TadD
VRNVLRFGLAITALCLPARSLLAASCSVVKAHTPSEAEKALLAADYAKAASLYFDDSVSHPGDAEARIGLVHALLRQQKVQLAADAVKTALAAMPDSAALITLRGEVELRQGEPWTAGQSAMEAEKMDPCNPRVHMLLAHLERLSSLYAESRKQVIVAHQLDPWDPEIRGAWIGTLSLKEKIAELEAYLSAPTENDEEDTRHWRMYMESLKKMADEPHKACHLVSSTTAAEIPFEWMMRDATHIRAFGLDVKLNGRTARLEIDTGAGGLLVSRSVAEHAGLKPFSQTEMSGIGDKGNRPGYSAYADSIRIGNLEFQDCQVRVLDSRNGMGDSDGLIGMDVFSQFLVTLDYPVQKLLLGPLPPRPGETSTAAPALKTAETEREDPDEAAEQDKPAGKGTASGGDAAGGKSSLPAATQSHSATGTDAHGPYDRYVAPEMQGYTPVYRSGHLLILPASLNAEKLRLFVLDTGSFTTTISPQAAREVTKVRSDDHLHVTGISGKVEDVYSADEVTFRFAGLSQKATDVVAFDTSQISKGAGMEISGLIGATTLGQLTMHIDYRDGLVKFDYDPKRGRRF